MKVKIMIGIICLLFSVTGFTHSGGLDKKGGHKCSAKSKKKGLCSGYHYHRVTETMLLTKLDKTREVYKLGPKE